MNLDLLTSPGDKPWLNIVCDSLTTKTLNISDFEVKGDLTVTGSLVASNPENAVSTFISNDLTQVSTPTGTGVGTLSYSKLNNVLVGSGLLGANKCIQLPGGAGAWLNLTTPGTPDLQIVWSDDLQIWSCIDNAGIAVYTTPDLVTFTAGTPSPYTFLGYQLVWVPLFGGKFYVAGLSYVILASSNGSVYLPQGTTRQALDFAYSSRLGIIVGVGPQGPQYTTDGSTWINGNVSFSMGSVCYSEPLKSFFATPRVTGDLSAIYTSSDGKTWTAMSGSLSSSSAITKIIWSDNAGLLMLVGYSSSIYLSQDGVKFNLMTPIGSYGLSTCTYVDTWGAFYAGMGSPLMLETIQRFRKIP
jgi:hypothetical protein